MCLNKLCLNIQMSYIQKYRCPVLWFIFVSLSKILTNIKKCFFHISILTQQREKIWNNRSIFNQNFPVSSEIYAKCFYLFYYNNISYHLRYQTGQDLQLFQIIFDLYYLLNTFFNDWKFTRCGIKSISWNKKFSVYTYTACH